MRDLLQQACRSTSSASLFISLLAPIFCCVYFSSPSPLLQNIICTVHRQNQDRSVGSRTHCYGGYRTAKTYFSGIKSGRWLLRWKMMSRSCCWLRLSPSCGPPNLSGIILSVSSSLVPESHRLPEKRLIFKTSFCWCRRPYAVFLLNCILKRKIIYSSFWETPSLYLHVVRTFWTLFLFLFAWSDLSFTSQAL